MTFHARAAVPVLLLSSLALTGCSLFQQPVEPGPAQPTEEPAVVDEVITALEPLTGDEEPLPNSQELFDTLIEAGYDAEDIETTLDESPLGNEVPAKMFGVRVEDGCVVGEIRGGAATARLMPPSESVDTCLFGAVERPEGVDAPSGEERGEDDSDNGAGHIPGEEINRPREEATESPTEDSGGSGTGGGSGTDGGTGGSGGGSGTDGGSGDGPPELGGN
ncbi:hypothetical protein AB0I45_09260 [Brevibacterium sp. NPDC049920]|uniref:DUF6993 domain-containing protein n=1 Tax=Brevibacterium pityocampae TaxID=506594 RepID=A0ABP8JGE5_9MICO|nr:hypothetical protein [uncultured Brevibacterium sp.]